MPDGGHKVDLEAFELAPFQCLPHQAFDGADHFQVIFGDEGDRHTQAFHAPGATGAVGVSFGGIRDVIIDDVRDLRDVDAAGGDIGRHQALSLITHYLIQQQLILLHQHFTH